jgi:hypothetical protein
MEDKKDVNRLRSPAQVESNPPLTLDVERTFALQKKGRQWDALREVTPILSPSQFGLPFGALPPD